MTCFDETETAAIEELKIRVKQWAEEAGNKYALDYIEDSDALWRYCLAHNYNLDDAEKMFKESTAFKAKWNLDELYQEFHNDGAGESTCVKVKPRHVTIGKQVFYAGFLVAKSVNGGPIIVERLGKLDFAGLHGNKEAREACLKAYVCSYEKMWRLLRESNDKQKGIAICDLNGIGLSAMKYVSLIREVSSLSVANYPEMVERVVIVNAPSMVSMFWKVIKPFLPERTRKKVKIMGSDFYDEVVPLVEGGKASLPKFLGGQVSDEVICPAKKVSQVPELLQ
mmetsp:Transcript_9173/g.11454  ORF Transcript_9173/g.11454 Transcript_9173/m.11454 type:complete len:281 (-) Transcript_9173:2066-2908(-)